MFPQFVGACYSVGKSYVNGIQIAYQMVRVPPDTSSAEVRSQSATRSLWSGSPATGDTTQFLEGECSDSGRRSFEGRTLLLWRASAPIDFDMPLGHGRLRRHS